MFKDGFPSWEREREGSLGLVGEVGRSWFLEDLGSFRRFSTIDGEGFDRFESFREREGGVGAREGGSVSVGEIGRIGSLGGFSTAGRGGFERFERFR